MGLGTRSVSFHRNANAVRPPALGISVTKRILGQLLGKHCWVGSFHFTGMDIHLNFRMLLMIADVISMDTLLDSSIHTECQSLSFRSQNELVMQMYGGEEGTSVDQRSESCFKVSAVDSPMLGGVELYSVSTFAKWALVNCLPRWPPTTGRARKPSG